MKFWILWFDAVTKMIFGQFVKKKSDLVEVEVNFIEKLCSQYVVKVKGIQCDNARESLKLKEKLEELQYGIVFEMTAAGTPQHNSVVENAFATLYGRIRDMLNSAKLN